MIFGFFLPNSSIANQEGGEVTENAFLGHLSKHSGPVSTKVCLLHTSCFGHVVCPYRLEGHDMLFCCV